MTITWLHDPPQSSVPDGFLYVGQDNYYLGSQDSRTPGYVYSDSATSCIILILEGRSCDNHPQIALTHMSCEERILAFFDLVDQHFRGPVAVFALGANPPSADTSKRNRRILLRWIHAHTPSCPAGISSDWYIDQATLALGFRIPEKERSGCAGIDVGTGTVSTQAYALTELQRDPTGGVQTLFSIFGLAVDPPLALHDATQAFHAEHIEQLVRVAKDAHWERIASMDSRRILALCSSTPDDELPWFCDTLRDSARLVQNIAKNRGTI